MLMAATAGAEDAAGDTTVDMDAEEEPAAPIADAAGAAAAEEPAASSDPSESKNVDEIMADMAVSHAIRTPGATSQAHHRPLQL